MMTRCIPMHMPMIQHDAFYSRGVHHFCFFGSPQFLVAFKTSLKATTDLENKEKKKLLVRTPPADEQSPLMASVHGESNVEQKMTRLYFRRCWVKRAEKKNSHKIGISLS